MGGTCADASSAIAVACAAAGDRVVEPVGATVACLSVAKAATASSQASENRDPAAGLTCVTVDVKALASLCNTGKSAWSKLRSGAPYLVNHLMTMFLVQI